MDDLYDKLYGLTPVIINMCRAMCDSSVKANAEHRADAGIKQYIIRRQIGECCEWCEKFAHTYELGKEPKEVYWRHDNCKCIVVCKSGRGYTDVWSKKKFTTYRDARREREQEILNEQKQREFERQIFTTPEVLGTRTPGEWKKYLEEIGFEVKPLNRGMLAGIPFEKGGGFKINFKIDGRYYQYHPEKCSHHNGAYYKVSSGRSGVLRYEMNGKLKKGKRKHG
ncbi:MAG: hypothetical protein IJU01_04525 [Lachnospiraceae bacterium]|nr:hypothetical protein [Lachnospiraceae bacterium]